MQSRTAPALVFIVAVACSGVHNAIAVRDDALANPIRKVVTLLEAMAKKVSEDADKEEKLYRKFMCFCKEGRANLVKSIQENSAKGPAVEATIGETESVVSKLKDELVDH